MDVIEEDGNSRMGRLKMRVPQKIRDVFKVPERQMFFVLALLVSKIIASYVLSILITFLTDTWQLKLFTAILITNIQGGATEFLKICVSFLIDAKTGNFWMLVQSTVIYSIGIELLKHATPKFISLCDNSHICPPKALTFTFYLALVLVTIGRSGHEMSLEGFSPSQDEEGKSSTEDIPKEQDTTPQVETIRKRPILVQYVINLFARSKYQVIWYVVTIIGTLFASFGVPYIRSTWSDGLEFSAYMMGFSLLPLLLGTLFYTPIKAYGSPLTHVFHVMLKIDCKGDNNNSIDGTGASHDKQKPSDTEVHNAGDSSEGDHIAITAELPNEDLGLQVTRSGRRRCSEKHLEETRHLKNMIPMSLTFFMYGIVLAIGDTFFIEQGNGMKDNLGSIQNFPLQAFVFMQSISSFLAGKLYDYTLAIWIKKRKRTTDAVKIGLGMSLTELCCLTAMLVEKKRLRTIREHVDADPIPMTVFWLTPQFVLFGAMDGLASEGIEGFFSHKAPSSMKRYAAALSAFVTGIGIMLSVLIIWLIRLITKHNEYPGWIADTIKDCKLDRFYRFLSVVSAINFFIYVYVASRYSYKTRKEAQKLEVEIEAAQTGSNEVRQG